MSFSERIVKNWSRINDVEAQILDYLQNHIDELPSMSINVLVSNLFISQNTVIRLAKKLGFHGFAEMKYAIMAEARTLPKDVSFSEQLNTLSDAVIASNIARTIALIDRNQIAALLRRIKKARSVSVHGFGDSHYFAELLQKYFARVSDNVDMQFSILYDIKFKADKFLPADVAIFISASGTTATILELATSAKEHGTYTVSITQNTDNPLRHIVDESLLFCGDYAETKQKNVPDLTGLMLLLRYIANAYWASFNNSELHAPESPAPPDAL